MYQCSMKQMDQQIHLLFRSLIKLFQKLRCHYLDTRAQSYDSIVWNSLLGVVVFNIHPLDGKPTMIVGASYDIQGSFTSPTSSSSDLMLLKMQQLCQVVSLLGRAHEHLMIMEI